MFFYYIPLYTHCELTLLGRNQKKKTEGGGGVAYIEECEEEMH